MDTTIRNLDAEAYRRIKARAALEGRTLGEAVSEAIRRYVEADEGAAVAPPPAPGYYAGEVAEPGPGRDAAGAGTATAAEATQGAGGRDGPPPLPVAPVVEELFARLAELARPDRELLDELEEIQAAQPRLAPGPWES